jgi:hypothetical protein
MKRVLPKLNPTYRKEAVRRLQIAIEVMDGVTTPADLSLDDPGYLQTVYNLLGRIEFRLQMLDMAAEIIQNGYGSFYAARVKEIVHLQDLTKKQKETVSKMVKAYVYRDYKERQSKKTAQAETTPQ